MKIKSEPLQGDYEDRRMVYLRNMEEVTASKRSLENIINELINEIDNNFNNT